MKSILLSLAGAALLLAQSPAPEKKVEFEVASIRPAKQDGHHSSDSNNVTYRIHNLTLKELIVLAFEVDERQVLGGPNWVDSDSYDISAKIPEEFAKHTDPVLSPMLQSLLTDRFQLAIHHEPIQIPGYALVVAKKGPKMKPAASGQQGSSSNSHNRHLVVQNMTMERFAKGLSRNRDVGKLVVDKTGLTGKFDFELDWSPDTIEAKNDSDPPSIFTALQERLGLRLESTKITVPAIVIDRAEKPAEN